MSAFIVSQGTMDRVVAAIMSSGTYGQNVEFFAGVSTERSTNATSIGRMLYAMNAKAIRQRYGAEGISRKEAKALAGYTFKGRAGMRMDASELAACIKSMECLSYQCSEGTVPRSNLYKALEAAICRLALCSVKMTPAYEAAAWD